MQTEYHYAPCDKNAKLLNPSKYIEKEERRKLIGFIHAQDLMQLLPLQYTTFPGVSHSSRNSNINHPALVPTKASYNGPFILDF